MNPKYIEEKRMTPPYIEENKINYQTLDKNNIQSPRVELPDARKKRKFENLNSAVSELGSVIGNLQELLVHIGAVNKPGNIEDNNTPKLEAPSLVSMLNNLPEKIRRDIKKMNELIAEIKEALN